MMGGSFDKWLINWLTTGNDGKYDFQAVELAIDESSFTGETEPVLKSTDMEPKKVSSRISERKNVAFMGTLVRCGRGKVRVSLFLNSAWW